MPYLPRYSGHRVLLLSRRKTLSECTVGNVFINKLLYFINILLLNPVLGFPALVAAAWAIAKGAGAGPTDEPFTQRG